MENRQMVGDTDPPECSVYKGFSHINSRTCCIELTGEFSAAPAPKSLIVDPKNENPRHGCSRGRGKNRKGILKPCFDSTAPEACHVLRD